MFYEVQVSNMYMFIYNIEYIHINIKIKPKYIYIYIYIDLLLEPIGDAGISELVGFGHPPAWLYIRIYLHVDSINQYSVLSCVFPKKPINLMQSLNNL